MKLKPAESVWWDEDESRPKCDSLSLSLHKVTSARVFFLHRLKGRGGECVSPVASFTCRSAIRAEPTLLQLSWLWAEGRQVATSWPSLSLSPSLSVLLCMCVSVCPCVYTFHQWEETSKLLFSCQQCCRYWNDFISFYTGTRLRWLCTTCPFLPFGVPLMCPLINLNQRHHRQVRGRLLFQLNSAASFNGAVIETATNGTVILPSSHPVPVATVIACGIIHSSLSLLSLSLLPSCSFHSVKWSVIVIEIRFASVVKVRINICFHFCWCNQFNYTYSRLTQGERILFIFNCVRYF